MPVVRDVTSDVVPHQVVVEPAVPDHSLHECRQLGLGVLLDVPLGQPIVPVIAQYELVEAERIA